MNQTSAKKIHTALFLLLLVACGEDQERSKNQKAIELAPPSTSSNERLRVSNQLQIEPDTNDKKLIENTEAYIAAHGIVPGQVNQIRIGSTLFRFPANVGLTPYTAQETYRSKNGSPMTLSTKEGMDKGIYERLYTPIVKGQADKVSFYLMPERGYAPNPNMFGGGIRVEISARKPRSWDGVNVNLDISLTEIAGRQIVDHPVTGLREYIGPKPWIGSKYEDIRPDTIRALGHGKIFSCQPSPGFCFIGHWNESKKIYYEIIAPASFVLKHWPEPANSVAAFIDSALVHQ